RMDSAATTEAAITVPEQILPITTPRATYRFSSIGAGIVSATMNGYKNLATKKGDVELKLSGRPLLSLALVANRDTINLDRTAFQVFPQRSDSARGGITYTATVAGGAQVAISYLVDPAHYMVHVSGRVDGV